MHVATRLLGVMAAVAIGFGPSHAAAQTPQAGQGGQARTAKPVERRLANALDQYALVQARKWLQLTDAQYEQFVPHLQALQQARRRNQQARNRIIGELRRLAGARATGVPDEAAIARQLAALRDQDERAARELRDAYDAIDAVLTVPQRARFRLFEENLEIRKLELLMRARGRTGQPGGAR